MPGGMRGVHVFAAGKTGMAGTSASDPPSLAARATERVGVRGIAERVGGIDTVLGTGYAGP